MNDETKSRLETLEAIVTAQTIVLTALIQTHLRHEDWQLAVTAALEIQLARHEQHFSAHQAELIRSYVEDKQAQVHLLPGATSAYLRGHLPPA